MKKATPKIKSFSEHPTNVVIEKDLKSDTEKGSSTLAKKKKGKTPTQGKLIKAYHLATKGEWREWLQSDLLCPYWIELWNSYLKKAAQAKSERGVGLNIVQKRIMSGESLGNTKYSGRNPDKASWDEADHVACFVWHIKHENTRSNNGIFYNRNLSDTTIEKIIWGLKNWIRQKHAPSYINTAIGRTALFGTTREGKRSKEPIKKTFLADLYRR